MLLHIAADAPPPNWLRVEVRVLFALLNDKSMLTSATYTRILALSKKL